MGSISAFLIAALLEVMAEGCKAMLRHFGYYYRLVHIERQVSEADSSSRQHIIAEIYGELIHTSCKEGDYAVNV